jgi:hypothetical protein
LFIAITCYYLGFTFIPNNPSGEFGLLPVYLASTIYFGLLPVLYWFLIIKAGNQKAWKLIIIFSLSCAIARYSFPEGIAQYFEFIMWLRYPIIAILLIIELSLMVMIVKGLWQARKLTGDPRIGVIGKYDDEKKQGMALTFATEPASWYYAIPRLSRNHVPPIAKISLLSGSRWHFFAIIISLIVAALISYHLLVSWSETVAIIAATFILYGFILMTANHRLSRRYSIYIQDEILVINNTIFNFMPIPLAKIKAVVLHDDSHEATKESLKIGRAKQHNIKISFTEPLAYWGMMGAFVENFDELWLNVEQPAQFTELFSEINCPKLDVA